MSNKCVSCAHISECVIYEALDHEIEEIEDCWAYEEDADNESDES